MIIRPQDADDYVHRIGRTARAGALGKAISFADEDMVFHLPEIEEYIGLKIPSAFAEEDDFCWDYRRPASRKKAPVPERRPNSEKRENRPRHRRRTDRKPAKG